MINVGKVYGNSNEQTTYNGGISSYRFRALFRWHGFARSDIPAAGFVVRSGFLGAITEVRVAPVPQMGCWRGLKGLYSGSVLFIRSRNRSIAARASGSSRNGAWPRSATSMASIFAWFAFILLTVSSGSTSETAP